MNSHEEIRRRLPAYCGGDLDATERRLVDRHLADCPACRAELTDLQTVLSLVRSTPAVDPPPWMTARVMARIRAQQAAKRSWLQRLFLPLRVRLPLEAIALLLVCVSGYYLTRTVETDLQQTRQQQLQETPAQPAPPAAAPAAQPPAGRESAEPPAADRPLTKVPAAPAPQAAPRRDIRPDQAPSNTPTPPAPASYAPAPPAYRDQQGGKAESMKAAPAAESSNRALEALPEKKMKGSRSLERRADEAVPAAAGRADGAPAGPALPRSVVRLSVDDPTTAPSMIREALLRSGGTVNDESGFSGRRIRGRIPAGRQDELLQRLERLGRISERPATPPAGTQLLDLTIQW